MRKSGVWRRTARLTFCPLTELNDGKIPIDMGVVNK